MNHAFLSASGGDRSEACPAAYALPADPRTESDDAARGTDGHAYLERLQSMSRDESLALCGPARETCEGIGPDDVPNGEAEIAYVWDVATDTVIKLGRIEHRGYAKALGRPLRDTEIPCTVDLVWDHPNTGRAVRDWKFGHWESVPDPRTSMQLALGALCVARDEHRDVVTVEIARVTTAGGIELDDHDHDAFSLEDAADRWRTAWTMVTAMRGAVANGESITTNPGEHCRWCPAKGSCPSFAGIARELLAPGSDWLSRAKTLIDDDAVAADLWLKVQRGRELLATMQGLLEARAVERPFALPDGMIVRQVETSRDSVANPKIVLEVLTDLYGAEVASAVVATKLHTTKGAIEKAAAAQAPKGQGAKETRRVLTVLRERNAIVTSTGVSVEAVEPKRLGKAS